MSTALDIGKQQAKSIKAKHALESACTESLYRYGYGETSILRVAAIAGLSKGALQHHFRSKEDLMTATADALIRNALKQTSKPRTAPKTVEEALVLPWKIMVNTPAYRALLEILTAARTDKKLQERISDKLHKLNKAMDQQAVERYRSVDGNDGDVIALLTMTRSLMRGLIIQDRYSHDPSENDRHIDRWIKLIAPQLELR